MLLFSLNATAQQASTAAATSAVKNVQITPSAKEAEVGQQVKLTVIATDASGNAINEKPSAFFAGPFDIAAVDDDGNVKLFGIGEVTVGALVGGTPGFTTFMVKPPSIKTVEISSVKSPLVVGGSVQLTRSRASLGAVHAQTFPSTGLPIIPRWRWSPPAGLSPELDQAKRQLQLRPAQVQQQPP